MLGHIADMQIRVLTVLSCECWSTSAGSLSYQRCHFTSSKALSISKSWKSQLFKKNNGIFQSQVSISLVTWLKWRGTADFSFITWSLQTSSYIFYINSFLIYTFFLVIYRLLDISNSISDFNRAMSSQIISEWWFF